MSAVNLIVSYKEYKASKKEHISSCECCHRYISILELCWYTIVIVFIFARKKIQGAAILEIFIGIVICWFIKVSCYSSIKHDCKYNLSFFHLCQICKNHSYSYPINICTQYKTWYRMPCLLHSLHLIANWTYISTYFNLVSLSTCISDIPTPTPTENQELAYLIMYPEHNLITFSNKLDQLQSLL